MKRVGFKAPDRAPARGKLIESGAAVSLQEGLAMELSHLEEIFTTQDAHAGLRASGQKAPVFQGA
jgi:hypothetical protein